MRIIKALLYIMLIKLECGETLKAGNKEMLIIIIN